MTSNLFRGAMVGEDEEKQDQPRSMASCIPPHLSYVVIHEGDNEGGYDNDCDNDNHNPHPSPSVVRRHEGDNEPH